MAEPERITAVAMLCDYAQVADEKLNIMGGGWSYLWAEEEPVSAVLTLAVSLSIPWGLTNQDLHVRTQLFTEDHEPILRPEDEEAIRMEGDLRVGRPPNARAGIPIVVPFVLPFGITPLSFGGYVWEIDVNDQNAGRIPFQVARRSA
jgi:hypothetical protein